jgi:hypothetical protein
MRVPEGRRSGVVEKDDGEGPLILLAQGLELVRLALGQVRRGHEKMDGRAQTLQVGAQATNATDIFLGRVDHEEQQQTDAEQKRHELPPRAFTSDRWTSRRNCGGRGQGKMLALRLLAYLTRVAW